jgi:hypothetical protein
MDRTAGILAARLLFPDRTTSAVRWLAGAYTAAAAASVATLLLSPAARSAARQHVQRFKASGPLAAEAALRVEQLGGLLQRYGEPAFVLLATAALWAYVHPTSAQLGECIAGMSAPGALLARSLPQGLSYMLLSWTSLAWLPSCTAQLFIS